MPRRPSLIVAGAVAAVALTASCTSTVDGVGSVTDGAAPSATGSAGSSASPGSSAGRPLAWHDCGGIVDTSTRGAHVAFTCATLSVPLDYGAPSAGSIDLQLIKAHDPDDEKPVGSLLLNPGGPGGSGLQFTVYIGSQLAGKVTSKFDLIGFDPRGVGRSSPIECLSDGQKDAFNAASPDVLTPAGFEQARQAAQTLASACSAKYGSRLAQYNTTNTARDMDRIRRAVGDPRMNYLGFSYGTELGAAYAHLFPTTIRAMVLDGAVDPLTDPITSFANQLKGFEGAFDQFAAYCVKSSECSVIGEPRQAVYALAAKARSRPIPSAEPDETRTATSSIVYTAVLSALYSKQEWPLLGEAIHAAQEGDAQGLFQLADNYNERTDGHYTNILEANTTISCNDQKPGPTDDQIRATAKAWTKEYPIFGAWSAPALFSCQPWQPERTVLPLPTAPTPNKVLVIGNKHDPATPYQGAVDLTRTLGNAELLSWDGEGHTSYLEGSSCVDDAVNSYLVDGTLPPSGTLCPA